MEAKLKQNRWILIFSAFIILFLYLGYRALWTCEGRWAEVTREMLLTHDFFHPTINGSPYFDKPLLTYWVICITAWITGHLNELSVRIPSAIAGLIALWATYSLGKRLWSKQVALISCWILLTTYGFLFWARTGTADMENMAAVILAVSFYWTRRENPTFSDFLIFYLICFVGSLFKGLTAFVCPVLAILPDVILSKRIKKYLSISNVVAFIIALIIYLAPFIYAAVTSQGYKENGLFMVFRENIERYIHPFDHRLPFYCYTYYLPMLMIPWVPLWIGALIKKVKDWKTISYSDKWLLLVCAMIFIFFTLSGSRRSYYILPILPFCCLLTASAVVDSLKLRSSIMEVAEICELIILAFIAIVCAFSPFIWPILNNHYGFVATAYLKTATLVIGVLAIIALLAYILLADMISNIFGLAGKISSLIICSVIVMAGFFIWQTNAIEAYRTQKPFALSLKVYAQGIPSYDTAFYKKVSANVIFYLSLPKPVTVLHSIKETKAFLGLKGENRVFVIRRRDYYKIYKFLSSKLKETPDIEEQVFPWDKNSGKKFMAWYLPSQ